MNIHKSQLFWCELQGYKVLTHCDIGRILGWSGDFYYWWQKKVYIPICQLWATNSATKHLASSEDIAAHKVDCAPVCRESLPANAWKPQWWDCSFSWSGSLGSKKGGRIKVSQGTTKTVVSIWDLRIVGYHFIRYGVSRTQGAFSNSLVLDGFGWFWGRTIVGNWYGSNMEVPKHILIYQQIQIYFFKSSRFHFALWFQLSTFPTSAGIFFRMLKSYHPR